MYIVTSPKKKKESVGKFCLTAIAAAVLVTVCPAHAGITDVSELQSDKLVDGYVSSDDINVSDKNHYLHGIIAAQPGATVTLDGKHISSSMALDKDFGNDYTLSGVTAAGFLSEQDASQEGATLNLGGSDTESIRIASSAKGMGKTTGLGAIGIWAYNQHKNTGKGGQLIVTAKNLEVNVHSESGDAYGIYAQNSSTQATKDKATLIVNADNTRINVTSGIKGNAAGIVAMSEGIVKVNGHLEVNADKAVVARGNAVVRINESGDRIVKLNGDIDFNYDNKTSGTGVDADVLVNLSGADSYWNGNTAVSYGTGKPADDQKLNASGLKLGLSSGAQWNPTVIAEKQGATEGVAPVAINELALNNGVINLNHGNAQTVSVKTLKGTGGTVNIKTTTADGKNFDAGSLEVGQVEANNGTPGLAVNFTGITADDVVDMTNLKDKVTVADKSNGGISQTQTVAEGVVKGTLIQNVDENGNVTAVTEQRNTGTEALKQIGAMNFLTFRAQMNDVSKRMGDLRTMPQASGIWARAIAGQSEYKSIHNTYQTLQVGADRRIGDFYIGGTVNYTDGDGKLNNGSTDDKNYSFGLYGGWLGEDGQFVDVIVKRHKLETDFDIGYLGGVTGSGSMDTWGTSASVEYGWRFGLGPTGYYVEPQAELMIGHLNSVSYTNRTSLGDVRVKQDGIKTTVGRLGLAGGWVSPDKTGSLYVKASVLHDWEGDAKTSTSKDGIIRSETEEMGGTWGEFALGGTWNINKNLAAYGEVETTAGNPVRTTYQVSGGIRYSF
ncbi:autotransporter outer membrane beta-barrel domain-containing protein [Oxalobacter paraformigenes]|uniref:Outer membrane autotransporter barrel domain-containing protein n=1 Tax=Oxalobacter paraformigenes TaxID=556268 RepID=C3X435_9BURK|nr:autotransporter outer membrane beta-barrel domain-containing protein [Oxalobacter paraformigenes]EEO27971.1 outer membrane autotransporter barrel domain-containing protein [Oxalobacter paraformigenes]